MKKNQVLILLIVFAVAIAAFFLSRWEQFSWEKSYRYDHESPYDTKLIYELLLDARNGKQNHVVLEPTDHTLQTRADKSNYIFIGRNFYADSTLQANLLHFVERGNTAFISTENLPDFLDNLLIPYEDYDEEDEEYDSSYNGPPPSPLEPNSQAYLDSVAQAVADSMLVINPIDDTTFIQLTDSSYTSAVDTTYATTETDTAVSEDDYGNEIEYTASYVKTFFDTVVVSFATGSNGKKESCITPRLYSDYYATDSWSYFDTTTNLRHPDPIASDVRLIGYIKTGQFNLLSVPYGNGIIYLHLTPLAFTNHTLAKEENLAYSEAVFSYLNDGPIIWDEYAKNYRFVDSNSNNESTNDNPFRYILSQESLRWAWYAIIALVLLYFIFIGKRKQRVIPVIEPTRNTSLEFVKTVGQLYYLERDHRAICMHKMKLFHLFLRHRYNINVHVYNDDYIDRLTLISGVRKEIIQRIYSAYTIIEKDITISDKEFIDFHQNITHFYKECK